MAIRIGEVARRAGLATSAIRYYEREGLIPKADRRGNARVYGSDVFDRLALIELSKSAGFTIADIRQLVELKRGDTTRCNAVRPLIEGRLSHVDTRIDELQQIRRTLHSFLDICKRSDQDGACEALEKLDD